MEKFWNTSVFHTIEEGLINKIPGKAEKHLSSWTNWSQDLYFCAGFSLCHLSSLVDAFLHHSLPLQSRSLAGIIFHSFHP